MRVSLREVKARTYKRRDSWWTVIFVDPVAVRLVWLLAPYRWATPNFVTALSFVTGVFAAIAFAQGSRMGLIAGGVLFYSAFVLDCVDGKIARLHQNGSIIGKWLEFVLDRVRFLMGAGALFYGQYQVHQNLIYIWAAVAIIVLDLLHYLNGAEMRHEPAAQTPAAAGVLGQQAQKSPLYRRAASFLASHRIRPRLFSGVEFEQLICVVAPITGSVFLVTGLTVGLHLIFEAAAVYVFVRYARELDRATPAADESDTTTGRTPAIVTFT